MNIRKTISWLARLSLLAFSLSFVGAVGNPANDNPWWHATNLWVDPANSSGVASDKNSCLSQSKPCLTNREIINRLGGYSAKIYGSSLVINEMSSNLGLEPSIDFRPCVADGGWLTYKGVMTQVGTSCTLSAVSPRNTATGVLTTATATCPTGAGQLIMNATHPSSAFTRITAGSNVWTFTQPLTACLADTDVCPRTEVNTWANGDTITVWTMPAMNFSYVGSSCGGGSGYFGFEHIAFSSAQVTLEGTYIVVWEDMQVSGAVNAYSPDGEFANYYHKAGFFTFRTGGIGGQSVQWDGVVPAIDGGFFKDGADIQGVNFNLGVDLDSSAGQLNISGPINDAYLANNGSHGVLLMPGITKLRAANGQSAPILWGPGSLVELQGATLTWPVNNGSTTFLNGLAGIGGNGSPFYFGVQGGVVTACATTITTNPATFNCNTVQILPSKLDLAVASGGFGSYIWYPGGFSAYGQQ